MKSFRFGCKRMKDGILVSAVFTTMAIGMILTARFLVPDLDYIPGVVMGFGLLLLWFAPIILLCTWQRHTRAGDEQHIHPDNAQGVG